MSFVNATLVLSIGETVEEVTDSGFLGTTPTLSCSLLGDDALVQVRIPIKLLNHLSLSFHFGVGSCAHINELQTLEVDIANVNLF